MEIIKLNKAKNYRDIGGVKTKDGRVVKKNMLLRGTPLFKVHKNDIEILKEQYNLKTIVDLRTLVEINLKPDDKIDGITYLHWPTLTEEKAGISHEHKYHSFATLEQLPPMEKLYIDMVTGDSLDKLIKVFKGIIMMDEDKFAVVFHCSAGKDRTGILSALLLAFLGVDRVDILEDYLITNQVTKVKSRMAYLGILLAKQRKSFAEKIRMYYVAKESFLESALHELEDEYGSLDEFFAQRLDMTQEEMDKIRDKFLESPEL